MAARKHSKRQRGVILIMLTVSLMVIVPMAGLAFDVGLLYLIRTKLSAAVDAAVMAGARSLNRGMDLASQIDSARETANRYFDANFPEGLYGTSGRTFTATVAESGYRTRTVSGVASVTAPLYFLRLLGQDTATMSARGTAARRDVNLILVMDRSGSIESAGATAAVKGAATAFVSRFAEGRDRVGLISFSGFYTLELAPTMSFKTSNPSIYDKINNMVMAGNTGYARALWEAYQQLVAINEAGALNVIVFFTDGRPTALTMANFPVKTVADQRYGDGSSPYSSTSTLYNMPASSCNNSSPKFGFISAPIMTSGSWPPPITGTTWGVMDPEGPNTQDEWTLAASSSGCAYAAGSGTSYRRRVRRDIAYIPDADEFGNSTWGYKSYSGLLYPSGHPYQGKIRVDSWRAVRYAAYNLADNIAQRVRNDTRLVPIIFCIGLGGTSSEPIDHELLLRVSNDRNSPIFDPNKPAGLYVYSPTAAELDQAFLRVASEILRLAE